MFFDDFEFRFYRISSSYTRWFLWVRYTFCVMSIVALFKFLNRLSDFLFGAGRWVTATLGEQETLWQPGKTQPEWKW